MKETTLYGILDRLDKKIDFVGQRANIGISGEIVRNQALTNLLVKKGIFTQEELTTALGEVIQELNKPQQQEEPPKAPEIVPATPEQVAEVTKSAEETK